MTQSTNPKIKSDATDAQRKLILPYIEKLTQEDILVEIGTGSGLSSGYLRKMTDATIFTIDPYPYLFECVGVVYWRMSSEEAARRWNSKDIDFLIVDGDHTFNGIMTDIKCWLPKLAPDGLIAFDDYTASLRPGLCSIAVTVCLNALTNTGLLVKIKQEHGILLASASRQEVLQSDIDACWEAYYYLTREETYIRQLFLNENQAIMYDHFWSIYNAFESMDERILFRKLVDAYRTLQTIEIEGGPNALHNELAKQQLSMILVREIGRIYGRNFE